MDSKELILWVLLIAWLTGVTLLVITSIDSKQASQPTPLTLEQRVALLEMNMVCVKNATYNNLDYKEICVYSPELTKEIKKRLQ